MSYEIGKFYRVPCVKSVKGHPHDRLWRGEWVPIIGPLHKDDGPIQFPFEHWHVDWRFVTERMYKRVSNRTHYGDMGIFHHVACLYERSGNDSEDKTRSFFVGDVVERRIKCRRPFRPYPHALALRWLKPLQDDCAAMKMTNMTCPHRGLPLDGCERDGDVVQCPGHGLRWNVKTGELVT